MKIEDHWFILFRIYAADGGPADPKGKQPEVASSCHGDIAAPKPVCGKTKFPYRTAVSAYNMREALCIRNTISVVVDGEYAGIVGKPFFYQNIQRPEGFTDEGIAGGTVAGNPAP